MLQQRPHRVEIAIYRELDEFVAVGRIVHSLDPGRAGDSRSLVERIARLAE